MRKRLKRQLNRPFCSRKNKKLIRWIRRVREDTDAFIRFLRGKKTCAMVRAMARPATTRGMRCDIVIVDDLQTTITSELSWSSPGADPLTTILGQLERDKKADR